jgi:two-component system sensor histidine kinase UhpB
MRHSEATIVQLFLKKQNDNILLKVHDNGKGITGSSSTQPRSFGLIGMPERVRSFGGEFTVSGTAADGTTIKVSIPLDIAPDTAHITMSPT